MASHTTRFRLLSNVSQPIILRTAGGSSSLGTSSFKLCVIVRRLTCHPGVVGQPPVPKARCEYFLAGGKPVRLTATGETEMLMAGMNESITESHITVLPHRLMTPVVERRQ